MKKILMLIVALAATFNAMAQMPGNLQFVGKGEFYLPQMMEETMTIQENDVVTVTLGAEGTSSITLPKMTYEKMHVTVSPFTIDNARWSMEMTTMESVWSEQEFNAVAVGTDGVEKAISGKLSANYIHKDKKFHVSVKFNYGSMPFEIAYSFTGVYRNGTAIDDVLVSGESADTACYSVSGQRVRGAAKGIVIKNGRKYIAK